MMAPELVVDSKIRLWVFLPIFIITFLFGLLRHYLLIMITNQKKFDRHQLQYSHAILRVQALRENNKYIPNKAFQCRKNFFNDKDVGYLTQDSVTLQQNLANPNLLLDLLKGNMANVLPMIVLGGWISWVFSGFLTTKSPFPLTLRFKIMLQKDIELMHLDPSWISSVSWYFLNFFGLRSIYTLALGENFDSGRHDRAKNSTEDQVSNMVSNFPMNYKVIFKAEWEALELIHHQWKLAKVEYNFLKA
ncbi:ER membrane protein complex subunit 3-like isoform X2 [Agrilus planipennis]|uniref:ER membrane protein complex subunit 3 n=1 Tax=Agrilus planipennis TaxID=224129 RepID=A0A1W4WG55_AGRPL|nr:ER membrane protein complex subunit 3-like isoform X1 [Agrilus planipennis]XP_025831869.1 ER membrane protein complex subunit 3-like isoform X2 [Agrilus planipennis]